jgi:hypothetical protein
MARHPAANAESQKALSRRILVNIKRDMTEITPRVIWAHELPLLQELHGESEVKEIEPSTLDEGYSSKPSAEMLAWNKTMEPAPKPSTTLGLGFAFIGDAGGEWQRLADAYGKHPEENVLLVEKVYGRFQSGTFARLVGSPELADLPEAQLRQLVRDYGYAAEPHKDASVNEKNDVYAKRKALSAMGHADLVKLAEEVGVEIG